MHPQTNVRIRLSFFLLLPVTKRDWYLHNPCLVTFLEHMLTAVAAHVGAKTYLDDFDVHKTPQRAGLDTGWQVSKVPRGSTPAHLKPRVLPRRRGVFAVRLRRRARRGRRIATAKTNSLSLSPLPNAWRAPDDSISFNQAPRDVPGSCEFIS
jgi:hypothetical protein